MLYKVYQSVTFALKLRCICDVEFLKYTICDCLNPYTAVSCYFLLSFSHHTQLLIESVLLHFPFLCFCVVRLLPQNVFRHNSDEMLCFVEDPEKKTLFIPLFMLYNYIKEKLQLYI